MPHATFTKRYVYSKTGMSVFNSVHVNGYIEDWQGVFLEQLPDGSPKIDGPWLGVVVPKSWQGAIQLESLPGVTLLPSLHDPDKLHPEDHVPLMAHAGVTEEHTMWQAAKLLHQ